MSWKQLNIDDLRTILSEDEVNSLNTLSLKPNTTDAINSCIDLVSDTWRGALLAKSYRYDIRDHYTPSEYSYWILVHARWAIWTRFPMSPDIALDEARKEEYKQALKFLQNPSIGVTKPDWEYDSGNPANGVQSMGSISVPWMRFDEDPWLYDSICK